MGAVASISTCMTRACGDKLPTDDPVELEKMRNAKYKELHAVWLAQLKRSPSHVLFIPGLMGSELVQTGTKMVQWLDALLLWKTAGLAYDAVDEKAGGRNAVPLYANDIAVIPILGAFYTAIFREFNAAFFAWDWRNALDVECARLAQFLDLVAQDPDLSKTGIHIVGHSLGALLIMLLVGGTDRFDKLFKSITFVSPPFGGSLTGLGVLENDLGRDAFVDAVIESSRVQQTFATMPAAFNTLLAPADQWVGELPRRRQAPLELQYPLRDTRSLFTEGALRTNNGLDKRKTLQRIGQQLHEKLSKYRFEVAKRLEYKINVIAAVNCKTPYYGELSKAQGWLLRYSAAPQGMLRNGDGVVLFESSFLPGIDPARHWVAVADSIGSIHAKVLERKDVLGFLGSLFALEGSTIVQAASTDLLNYWEAIDRIHWEPQLKVPDFPTLGANTNFLDRAALRRRVPQDQWEDQELDPIDPGFLLPDSVLFDKSWNAAKRVVAGEQLPDVLKDTGLTDDFLAHFLGRIVSPVVI